MTKYPLAEGRQVIGNFAVYPNSLLFKAGDYPEIEFAITPSELSSAADAFAPLEFNSEHDTHGVHKAVLSGIGKHFGGLGGPRRVWIDPADPAVLRGEVAVPLWLDSELETKSLSMEIDRATKRFTGAGLTYTPRVSEAALMSSSIEFAMSRHNTPEGQQAMQSMHDMAARSGAVCDRKNVSMSSQHEATAIQKIHDMTTDHGATCSKGDAPAYYSQNSNLQKGKTMFDKLKSLFSKAGVPDADIDATLKDAVAEFNAQSTPNTPTNPGMTEAQSAEFSALKAANAKLIADTAQMQAGMIKKEAEHFVGSLISTGRAAPYEQADLVALFCQAAEDDAAAPKTVTFSAIEDGKPVVKSGSRLDAFQFTLAKRPSSGLTTELFTSGRQMTPADFSAVFAKESDKETADEKEKRIQKQIDDELAKTDTGKKVLAARNGSK